MKFIASLKKQKKNFAIVFRTFGDDCENVKLEFNRFVRGTHPMYNGQNGTTQVLFDGQEVKGKHTKMYNISDDNCATFYRFDDDVYVVFDKKKRDFAKSSELEDWYVNSSIKWLKGHHQIQVYFNGLAELKNSAL